MSESPLSTESTRLSAAQRANRSVRALVSHGEVRHASKYAVVGVCNVAIDFALYAVLVWLGTWYVAAKAISVVAATINGYTFNRSWTFRAGRYSHISLARYVTVQTLGFGFNVGLLTLLVERFDRDPIAAQAFVVPFVAGFCFTGHRLWTFRGLIR